MIQNLNKFSFAAFGRVLAESAPDRGFPQEPNWTREQIDYSTGPVRVYRVEAMPVYLDIERGMTVLAVAREGEELEYFYLDKPVCLQPEILFALVPRGSCTVNRALHSGGHRAGGGHRCPLPRAYRPVWRYQHARRVPVRPSQLIQRIRVP